MNEQMKICFACGRKLKAEKVTIVTCSDEQTAFVGPECFRKIKKAGKNGWQPPLGGPRLYQMENNNENG